MIKLRVSRSESDATCYHLTLDVLFADTSDPDVRGASGRMVLEVAKERLPFQPKEGEEFPFPLGDIMAYERSRQEKAAADKAEAERQLIADQERWAADAAGEAARVAAEQDKVTREAAVKAAQAELQEAEMAADPQKRVEYAKQKLEAAKAAAGA